MEASKKPDEIVPSPIVDLLARLNRIALIVPDPTVRFPIDSSPLLKTELDCAIELWPGCFHIQTSGYVFSPPKPSYSRFLSPFSSRPFPPSEEHACLLLLAPFLRQIVHNTGPRNTARWLAYNRREWWAVFWAIQSRCNARQLSRRFLREREGEGEERRGSIRERTHEWHESPWLNRRKCTLYRIHWTISSRMVNMFTVERVFYFGWKRRCF